MASLLIHSLAWRWDRNTCTCWADMGFADGTSLSIGLPLALVVKTWDECAARCGLQLPPMVGAVDSVDGLFSSIKKAVKSAAKSVSKAAKSAVNVTSKVLAKTAAAAAAVAKSRVLTYGLMAVAAVVPAVGAPALAAQLAAKQALQAYDDAKAAKRAIQSGVRTAKNVAAVTRGGNILQAVSRLANQNNPRARLAVAALRSLPARA